ncbi:MAG TPA: hypothetical protein VI548_03830 [Chitinophagaceae bacterium]|nr:hypothetical protein [Chitinophagaceae bacterium]
MKRLFSSGIVMVTLFLFTTACNKEIINSYPDEEIMTSRFNAKLNNNSCAVITAALVVPDEVEGNAAVRYIISWKNQGGKKFIEVIPEDEGSFFINASDATGLYSWARQVESPYGEFTFRTITRTGGSPGEGSICQDKTWILAIEPPF